MVVAAAGPLRLPERFADAENNESTSFLPGDAEATKALAAVERLQRGELAPAVIVYRRESGLRPSDLRKIRSDVARMAARRFPTVVADGAAASGAAAANGRAPARRAPPPEP